MRPRWGSRTAAAIALSLAVHAALLAAMLSRHPAARSASPPSFPVELRPRAAAPPARSPVGTPPSRASPLQPAPGAAHAGEVPGAEGGGPGTDEVVRWLSGSEAGGRGGAGALATPVPRGSGPPRPGTLQERLAVRVGEVLDAMRAADLARYPDASWTGLRAALGEGFVPPEASLDLAHGGGIGGGGPGFLARALDGYGAAAARYGSTGSPIPPGPDAPGSPLDSTRAQERTVAAAGAIGHKEREPLAAAVDALDAQAGPSAPLESSGGLVAVVAVTLDAAGAVAGVRLVSRSASADYDRAALAQAERLAGRELSRRLAGTVTEWVFVTEVLVRPPSAAAAVRFDATFRPAGISHPLERVTRTRIELRAVRRGSS